MSFDFSRRAFLSATAAAISFRARSQSPVPAAAGKGIIDLTNSPHAHMRNVPVGAVKMADGFWAKRMQVNKESSIPFTYREMADHGRFDNFLRWDGPAQTLKAGFHTDHPSGLRSGGDSETYKWIEAASFAIAEQPDPDLRKTLAQVVQDVLGAQEPNGYLNTYFVEARTKDRMLPATQASGQELFIGGHLLTAGITYRRVTGDSSLQDAGVRYVDNFLLRSFGPQPDQQPLLSGHPEIELALVELYRATRDNRHLDLAGYILHGDDRIPLRRDQYVSLFCGIPFTSRTELEGHAVRCLYACCGAADYYMETGDAAYGKTLEALWQDLVNHKMYITGGVGARRSGEAFGDPYELPNLQAYSESCAAIANAMWNWRLLCASGESRFMDVVERALYNGVNSGTSLDGKLYNYCNPLALDESASPRIRKPWYSTNCCPPNLERAFASVPGHFYGTAKDGIYVHLYENSELNWRLEDGTGLKLIQKTGYPWSGDVALSVMPEAPVEFTVYIRIPGWSGNTKVKVNDAAIADATAGRYLPIRRRWSGGDTIALQFDMTPRITAANPKVESDAGRVAVERGPLVYCMEQIDQPDKAALDGFSLALSDDAAGRIEPAFYAGILGGVVTLRVPGFHASSSAKQGGALYQTVTAGGAKPAALKLIPYYAFANREPSPMQVWIPYTRT
jgi:uncharacterized protein